MTDEEILKAFRSHKTREKGFNWLVEKYHQKLYWLVRRMVTFHEDADDVIQNVFIKVWRNLDSFRADAKLYTWLYRIASNEAITFLNKKQKRAVISLHGNSTEDTFEAGTELAADSWFDGDAAQKKLQMAIMSLPDKQKLVFNLRYFEEIKYHEMAAILNTSEGSLKASYHHAVKKIEAYLKTH